MIIHNNKVIALLSICGFILTALTQPATSYSIGETIKADRSNTLRKSNDDKICETQDCVETAARILQNMDKTKAPCDDFYQFTCGNYVKNTKIPDYKSGETTFGITSDKLQDQLKSSFESDPKDSDPKPFRLLHDYYKICMNNTEIDKNSEGEFMEVLNSLGGWPILMGDSWDEKSFDWMESTTKFLKTGYSTDYFVSFDLDIDMKNNTLRIVTLDQGALGLSQKYLSKGLEDKVVKAYYDYMVDLAVMLGADREKAKNELLDSINFEIALANISLPAEKRRDAEKLYNMMRSSEITERFADIPWVEYINKILSPYTKIDDNELINIAVPSYLDDLNNLIKSTPKRVMANYAMWRITKDSVPMLSERLRDRLLEYSKALTGASVKAPRWKKCIGDASGSLNLAASALYVRKYFDENAKKSALGLIESLRSSFRNILKKIDWMDEKTRTAALEKLEYVTPHIAYPDEFLDDKKLNDYYDKFELDPNSFVKTKLMSSRFHINRAFNRFRTPVNKTEWITHGNSAIVNAFYNPGQNSIQFPAGILQGAFFGNDRPKYMNYGSIGYVMGHEFTHGFDDQGKQFDKEGNLVNWWASETNKKYLERAQCIIDQYSNYTVEDVGLNLNGINTQGENIADNGGIKEAYFAYNDWAAENEIEPRLPGLHYTPQQMFWISAANVWCRVSRPEATKLSIITGVHSPGEFRVIGPMSNMPEFSKDFNCPLGSKMNPVKKCSVW